MVSSAPDKLREVDAKWGRFEPNERLNVDQVHTRVVVAVIA